MTAWYRTGTVTATNGSTTVTGNLTAFLANVKVGDEISFDVDGRSYEVTAVGSNTALEIFPAYAGTTGSGKLYGIGRISPNWNSVSEIAVSLAELLAAQSSILAGIGVPSDSLGNDGDVYFRQDVAEYYRKESGAWVLVTSLIGSAGPAGPSYQATSTSSVTIGTGAKTFTVQSGRGYAAGQWLRVSNSASNYMEGTVTSYSGTTLIINVPTGRAIGSGTYTSWNVNIAGDVGPANSLAIGSVTTGAAGSSASANITGTAPSQTLNLTIPRGNNGLQGDTGPQGTAGTAATIAVGTVDTVDPGDPATVTNSGTSGAAVLDFEIPRGADGADGTDGHLYATTSTTTLTPSVASKVFTVDTGLSYQGGERVRAASAAAPTTNWMSGIVTNYATDQLTVAVDLFGPSPASASDWNITITGEKGDQGATGGLGVLSATKGNLPVGDGTTFGTLSVGADGTLPLADTGATYGISWTAVDAVLAGGYWSQENVASAATCDIGAATSAFVVVTGTTTITSFGTAANKMRIVRFAGALTLTYNGTSLVLPGTANIVTAAGDCGIFCSDASGNWRCIAWTPIAAIPRERLTANRTYYVRTDGNDNNTGLANSSGGAFLTIQKAVNVVAALDISTFDVTIQLGNGSYSAFTVSAPWIGSGTVTVNGDTSTPSNVTITSSFACVVSNGTGSRIKVSGVTLAGTGIGFYATGGQINGGAGLVFAGTSTTGHMRTNGVTSNIILNNSYTITGSAARHYYAGPGGMINPDPGITVTVSGTPNFSTAFAYADRLAIITTSNVTYSGSATGQRYNVSSNAVINTPGQGANFFPGNSAGAAATGGQYI